MNIIYIENFRQIRETGMLKEEQVIQKDLGESIRDETIKVGRSWQAL